MGLEIQTGQPTVEGRYVIWIACRAVQIRDWCEPSIATFQGGRWHSYEPVMGWIGPLPVVTHKECLDKMRVIVAKDAADFTEQYEREYDL